MVIPPKSIFDRYHSDHAFAFFAQGPDLCENRIPANWNTSGGTLSLSDAHYKVGKQSIRWDWQGKASILIGDSCFANAAADDHSCFAVWIYNEMPINDALIFNFEANQKTACSFRFNLNFSGWRTAWVMYHRDMQGKPIKRCSNFASKHRLRLVRVSYF